MARQVISHLNYISQNINDSVEQSALIHEREIYCRKLHAITEPLVDDCMNCPCFGGLLQGNGHECIWEDILPAETGEWEVFPYDKQKELLRVSKLIDKGYIQKAVVNNETNSGVQNSDT